MWKKLEGQPLRCAYCNISVYRNVPPKAHNRATMDHKVSRYRGGKDSIDNLVVSCYECNQKKGKLPREAFWVMSLNTK